MIEGQTLKSDIYRNRLEFWVEPDSDLNEAWLKVEIGAKSEACPFGSIALGEERRRRNGESAIRCIQVRAVAEKTSSSSSRLCPVLIIRDWADLEDMKKLLKERYNV